MRFLVRLIASGICHTDVLTQSLPLYISPLVLVNLGTITHFVGLKLIRGFVGMGVSRVGAIVRNKP